MSVGIAPHSVRACPAEWIRDISQEAFRRGKVINDQGSHLSAHELRKAGLPDLADKLDALLSAYRAGIAADGREIATNAGNHWKQLGIWQ